jgi:hypothetical protein
VCPSTSPRPPVATSLSRVPLALILAVTVSPLTLPAQQQWPGKPRLEAEQCRPGTGDGAPWLKRAVQATGLSGITGALQFTATEREAQYFQSDRMYPPFIGAGGTARFHFDPSTGAERSQLLIPGGGMGRDLVRSARSLFAVRGDTLAVPAASVFRIFGATLPLNPLAVLSEWQGAATTVVAHCRFRDYERVVVSRGIADERLYLHAGSGMPVKYERVEADALWGQQLTEYVYATWWQVGPAKLPVVSVRYRDGVEQSRRDIEINAPVVGRDVPRVTAMPTLPAVLPDHAGLPDPNQTAAPVDTVRIGPATFLLVTRAYTHAVTMVRDTVYLFDATTAEWRSRADSTWIATLFPGRKATVLVVTDLAWPHISGVRFWAARGATIATHALSVPFLTQVVNRDWTLAPDTRSRQRPMRPVRWISVTKAKPLGGGAIRLLPIDGIGSEGALMAWLPGDGFLWAGDYLQDANAASSYAAEVITAATREAIDPARVAAQHLGVTSWAQILKVNPRP